MKQKQDTISAEKNKINISVVLIVFQKNAHSPYAVAATAGLLQKFLFQFFFVFRKF